MASVEEGSRDHADLHAGHSRGQRLPHRPRQKGRPTGHRSRCTGKRGNPWDDTASAKTGLRGQSGEDREGPGASGEGSGVTSPIGATAVLVHEEDGWHIELELDDGRTLIQNEPSFETMEEAQEALDRFIEANGIEKVTVQ